MTPLPAPARAFMIPVLLLTLPALASGHVAAADAEDARIGSVERVQVELFTPRVVLGPEPYMGYYATLDFHVPAEADRDTTVTVKDAGGDVLDVYTWVRRMNASTIRVSVSFHEFANAPATVEHVLEVTVVDADTREPVATRAFAFHVVQPVIRLPAALVPVRALPLGLSGVAASPLVAFHSDLVPPASPLTLRVDTSVPNGTVHTLVTGRDADTVLAPLRADADGRVDVRFTPMDVTANASTGLLAVTATVADARENSVRVGATTIVIPAMNRSARVSDVTTTGGNVTVRVTEDSGGTYGGTIAFLKGTRILALADVEPPLFTGSTRVTARVPSSVVQDAEPEGQYTIAAFLTDADGAVHAMASATRGFRVTAHDLAVTLTEQAGLAVDVVNLNANGDDVEDAGLEATVRFRVTGLPGVDDAAVNEITLAEATNGTIVFPLGVPRVAGAFPVVVRATLGELALVTDALVTVEPATSALQDALARTPALGALPVLALAALAALPRVRRRHAD